MNAQGSSFQPKTDYGSGICYVAACLHIRIYDKKNMRYMPVCGYDCY